MSHEIFSVKPDCKIHVKQTTVQNSQKYGSLDSSFRVKLVKIDHINLLVNVRIMDVPGIWQMNLWDWVNNIISRRELDKMFLEGLYVGDLPLHSPR